MKWLVFSYSIVGKPSSSLRVSLWRRLKRNGAIAKGGVYILPSRDECLESFQWLSQEVQQAGGEALAICVERFVGLTDTEVINFFHQAREEEYQEIFTQAQNLAQKLAESVAQVQDSESQTDLFADYWESFSKLHKRFVEVDLIDFFSSSKGIEVKVYLAQIERSLKDNQRGEQTSSITLPSVEIAAYKDKQWVTRPRPYIDRLACIWLIRRFINPKAKIRYGDKAKPNEVAFEMEQAEFTHCGNLCTFEVMKAAFNLEISGLNAIAEIVHVIDLRDDRYLHPETIGVDATLRGWFLAGFTDAELESHGIALFEGLFNAFSQSKSP